MNNLGCTNDWLIADENMRWSLFLQEVLVLDEADRLLEMGFETRLVESMHPQFLADNVSQDIRLDKEQWGQ